MGRVLILAAGVGWFHLRGRQAGRVSEPTAAASAHAGDVIEVVADRVAAGGAALGLGPDGRAVFVEGVVPGERVRAQLVTVKGRWSSARLIEVLEPHPDRVDAPCGRVGEGCGGCDWQHISPGAQSRLRVEIVRDSLRRLGQLPDVDVVSGPSLPVAGYRTTVRAAVKDGRAALRSANSHETVAVGNCLVAHPLVAEILRDGRFGNAEQVTVRAGAGTGERLVLVEPSVQQVEVPADAVVVGLDELQAGREAWYHEVVDGHRFRISARSFFQAGPAVATALASAVTDATTSASTSARFTRASATAEGSCSTATTRAPRAAPRTEAKRPTPA